jgi:hypothetical protein
LLNWKDIDENMKNTIRLFLDNANEYSLTEEIIDKTVELRHKVAIKLPFLIYRCLIPYSSFCQAYKQIRLHFTGKIRTA